MLRDGLGENRTDYPMTAYLVAGTQSDRPKNNQIILMKMSQLRKTQEENEGSGYSLRFCPSRQSPSPSPSPSPLSLDKP